jgi:translation elongation factor EF-Ts
MDISKVKELRERTGMGYGMCVEAWKAADGNMDTALEILKSKGAARADKLSERSTDSGFVGIYRHYDGSCVAIAHLLCETDFVSKTEEFRDLADEIAMHLVIMEQEPKDMDVVNDYELVTRAGVTVREAIQQLSAKTGEKIALAKGYRTWL